MKINKLKLNYFGRFQNKEITLKSGINLIYGKNEAGKSTIHSFIKGMLYGIDRLRGRGASSKEDIYTKYLPWDYPGAYSGQMDLTVRDKEYRILRSFHSSDKNMKIIDLETAREYPLVEGSIKDLIPNLQESTYRNTVSIEQMKAQTDKELAALVRDYITNLSISKTNEVNVSKSILMLQDKKKQIEQSLKAIDTVSLKESIEEGLQKEIRLENYTKEWQELQKQEYDIISEHSEKREGSFEKLLESYPGILVKYQSYEELLNQRSRLLEQKNQWNQKKLSMGDKQNVMDEMKKDLARSNQLSMEIPEDKNLKDEFINERSKYQNFHTGKHFILSLIPVMIAIFINYAVLKDPQLGFMIPILGIVVGVLTLISLLLRVYRKKRAYDLMIDTMSEQIKEKEAKLQEIFHRNSVKYLEELSIRYDAVMKEYHQVDQGEAYLREIDHRMEELQDKEDLYHDEIMFFAQHFLSAEELNEGTMKALDIEVSNRKIALSQKQEEYQRRKEVQRLKLEKLRWEMDRLENNEDELRKNQEKLRDVLQKQKDEALELSSIKLALDTIQSISVDIHDGFGRLLNDAVSHKISEITEGKYSEFIIDEKLEVKVEYEGDYKSLDNLSAGTIDQIYFGLRLGVSELLLEGEDMPLILDDTFALYDDDRLGEVMKVLKTRGQVLLFSCHRREQKILEELGISYHFVDLID